MVNRIIDQYVEDVVGRLPVLKRRRAAQYLRKRIYASLRRYTGGEEPTNRDVRAILKALGSPKEVAEDYYDEYNAGFRLKKPDTGTVLKAAVSILLIISVVLVLVGLIGLSLGIIKTGMPVFIGAAISLAIMAAANIVPMPREEGHKLPDRKQ